MRATPIESTDTSTLRSLGGFFVDTSLSVVSIEGEDARRYLQSQSTNDINALETGQGQLNCFVDRKARPISVFHVYRLDSDYRIVCDNEQVASLIAHLDKFRFADKVEFKDRRDDLCIVIQGAKCRLLIKAIMDGIPAADLFRLDASRISIARTEATLFRLSLTGEDGYVIAVEASKFEEVAGHVKEHALALGMIPLSNRLIDTARIEAGIVKLGVDFNEENLLAETTLDQTAVSYTKGCFQGQEVLARIRTQGAPTRALVGLTLSADNREPFAIDTPLIMEGETIGWLKSNCYSIFLGKFIAIASIKRDYRTPGRTWRVSIDGHGMVDAHISLLPFYEADKLDVVAKNRYEEALQHFASEDESADAGESTSVKLLREALVLDPLFEDAYEALGVILSKRNMLDEAIELMEFLARLNPNSVMAHTNLSVFYVEKGWKEKAEEEKAISMSIRMQMAAQQMAKQKEEEAQRKASQEETEQRLQMFKQVLEIDGEDQLANFGTGDCLVELGYFAEAIPHLKKSIEAKPTHSVSYLILGRAFEGLKRLDDARRSYETGIEMAAKRGDMEPLKKMQERLAAL